MARTPSTNAHRMQRVMGPGGKTVAPWWCCSAPGCNWHPRIPAEEHGPYREQFRAHLYELVPKRG